MDYISLIDNLLGDVHLFTAQLRSIIVRFQRVYQIIRTCSDQPDLIDI